jgi:hypothetical protein
MAEPTREKLMRFFDFEHLPAEMQEISKPFGVLAREIHDKIYPDNVERNMALRKLLEAKDCAVRAFMLNKDKPK